MLMTALWTALKVVPTVFMALFPVVNPIGTSLILTTMTAGADPKEWRATSRKIALCSFLVLTFFYCFGYLILRLFGITIPVVQVSGGVVLALMGWQMLNGTATSKRAPGDPAAAEQAEEDTSLAGRVFYPFTFPLTIGPGGLAIAMTLGAHLHHGEPDLVAGFVAGVLGMLVMCIVMYLCYANMHYISARATPAAAKAISKMLAFFVICIGIQILWEGIQALKA